MSRIQRALVAASLSAITLSTLTQPATTFATGTANGVVTQYVVKAGDFLAGIAAKVGVALPDLLAVNNMTKNSLILPGDKLAVPTSASAPAPATSPVTPGKIVYTVKLNDFLAGIAASYKVTLADLLAVNNITPKTVITPGRQLAMPANAVAPTTAAPAAAAPTVAAPAVGAPAPALSNLTYTIKSNDFLAGIAAKYKVNLTDLLAVNQLKSSSLILPGLKLALPAGAVQPAAASAPAPVVESTAGPAAVVVAYAFAQLGKPYRFFTDGPDTFDCSGLVKAAYAQIGMVLVHQSAAQATLGTVVNIWNGESIKPGDLVFLATNGDPNSIHHVGIAVDATHWINAPKPGDVVRLAPIPPKGLLATVRRLIP